MADKVRQGYPFIGSMFERFGLFDQTSQVERLEKKLEREREYTAQVIEKVRSKGSIFPSQEGSYHLLFFFFFVQSTREKLEYEMTIANLSAVSIKS